MIRTSLLISAALLVASPALAASPIDGTWKIDTASAQFSEKPITVLLAGGEYSCDCTPPFKVKADGAFHKVVGIPYIDEASVKVLDQTSIEETDKLNGKVAYKSKTVLSPDGKAATTTWTDYSAPDGKAVEGSQLQTRMGAAPAGSHPLSGKWKSEKVAASDAVLTSTMKLNGNVLTMTTPNGYRYDATLGGKPVPIKGDTGNTLASVKKLADGSFEETDYRLGKPVTVMTMTPSADGKTISVKSHNVERNTDTTYTMIRQ